MHPHDPCKCAICTADELAKKKRLEDAIRIFGHGGPFGPAVGGAVPTLDDEIARAQKRLDTLKKIRQLEAIQAEIERLETNVSPTSLPKVTY